MMQMCHWESKPAGYPQAEPCTMPVLPGKDYCPLHFIMVQRLEERQQQSPIERIRKANEGKTIANALDIDYTGPQYNKAEFKFHLFTDPLTGSTFAATSLNDARKRRNMMRKKFHIL